MEVVFVLLHSRSLLAVVVVVGARAQGNDYGDDVDSISAAIDIFQLYPRGWLPYVPEKDHVRSRSASKYAMMQCA